jgi:MFS family permease
MNPNIQRSRGTGRAPPKVFEIDCKVENEGVVEPPAPPGAVGWRARYALAVLILLHIMSVTDRQMLSLLALPIQRDLGFSDTQLGLLTGLAFAVLYCTMGLPLGLLVDRVSRRLVICGGVMVWSLSGMACGLATGFSSLFAARVGVGVGEAALTPGAYSIIAALFPKQRISSAMAVYYTGAVLGVGIPLALGGWISGLIANMPGGLVLPIVGALKNWQAVLILTSLPGLPLALLVLTISLPLHPQRGLGAKSNDLSSPNLWRFIRLRRSILTCFLIGFALISGCATSISAWAPALLGRRYGWTPAVIGPGLALVLGAGGLAGVIVGGWIADKVYEAGHKDAHFIVAILSMLIAMPACIGAFLVVQPVASMTLLAVGFAAAMAFLPNGATVVQLITPDSVRGQMAAVYTFTCNMVGLGLGPTVVGLLTDHLFHNRAQLGLSLTLVVGVAGTLGVLVLQRGRSLLRAAIADGDTSDMSLSPSSTSRAT